MLTDIRKIWENSFLYNPSSSPVYACTVEMNDYFNRLYKEIIDSPYEDLTGESGKKGKGSSNGLTQGKAGSPQQSKVGGDRPLTYEEKRNLTEMIKGSLTIM